MHSIIMVNNLTNELIHIVLFMFQLFDFLTSTLYCLLDCERLKEYYDCFQCILSNAFIVLTALQCSDYSHSH